MPRKKSVPDELESMYEVGQNDDGPEFIPFDDFADEEDLQRSGAFLDSFGDEEE